MPQASSKAETKRLGRKALREQETRAVRAERLFVSSLKTLQRDLRRELGDQGEVAPEKIPLVQGQVTEIVERSFAQVAVQFRPMLLESFDTGWEFVDTALERFDVILPTPLVEVTQSIPFRWQALFDTASTFSATLITRLSDDTLNRINTIIASGAMQDIGLQQMIADIGPNLSESLVFKSINQRAEVIARTETMRVYSLANQNRLIETKKFIPDISKEWIWSGRSRKSHAAAEGQVVLADDPFTVAGEELMFPRDPAGSAKNTVRCGCASVPVVPPSSSQTVPPPNATTNVPVSPVSSPTGLPPTPISPTSKPPSPVQLKAALDDAEVELRVLAKKKANEKAIVIDKDGKIILEKGGGAQEVGFTDDEIAQWVDAILSHNHPAGGSFSLQDVSIAIKSDMAEIRAIGEDFTYILKRPEGGWQSWSGIGPKAAEAEKKVYSDIWDKVNQGKMTPAEGNLAHWHEVWKTVADETGLLYTRILMT